MVNASAVDLDGLDNLEDLCSELDAPSAVEITLPDKLEPKLPWPVKPLIRTRSGEAFASVQQQRSKQLSDFCQQRKITDICHFTRIENLQGILTEGLLPRAELEKRPAISRPIFTDKLRLDGHMDASCLSISFPNYKMFYRKRLDSKDDNLWAVIIYDYSVITRLNCAFTINNAAAGTGIKGDMRARNTVESLADSFGDFGEIQRKELKIPDHYTTNPQSEVLAFEVIPPRYIKKIFFYSKNAVEKWLNDNRADYPLNNCWYGGGIFKYRMDFSHWKRNSF